MKSCPKCNRTFPDEGQKFCTFDGGLLIAPQTFDPNATIRATSIDLNAASERPTSRDLPDPNATIIENYPATVALPRNTGPTTGPTSQVRTLRTSQGRPPPYRPNAASATATAAPPTHLHQPPAGVTTAKSGCNRQPVAHAPSAPLPPPVAQKKSKVPLIIAGFLFFSCLVEELWLPCSSLSSSRSWTRWPRNEIRAGRRRYSTRQPRTICREPRHRRRHGRHFVPPAGTVQFANSNDNLDGKLAEHYFDFSFYYPESWTRDPKSGVAGRH